MKRNKGINGSRCYIHSRELLLHRQVRIERGGGYSESFEVLEKMKIYLRDYTYDQAYFPQHHRSFCNGAVVKLLHQNSLPFSEDFQQVISVELQSLKAINKTTCYPPFTARKDRILL